MRRALRPTGRGHSERLQTTETTTGRPIQLRANVSDAAEQVLFGAVLIAVVGLWLVQIGAVIGGLGCLALAIFAFYRRLVDGGDPTRSGPWGTRKREQFAASAAILGTLAAACLEMGIDGGFALLAAGAAVALAKYYHVEPEASGLDAAAEPEEQATCAGCGRPVGASERRCEDCAVVGSWRK